MLQDNLEQQADASALQNLAKQGFLSWRQQSLVAALVCVNLQAALCVA